MSIPSSKTSQIIHGGPGSDPYHIQSQQQQNSVAEHLSQHHQTQQHLDQQSHNFTVENLMTAQQLHHENLSREPSPNQEATPPLEEGGVASPYHRPMSTNWPPPTNSQQNYEDHQGLHGNQPQPEAAMEAAVANYRAWYTIPASSSPNVDPYHHQSSTTPPPPSAISRDSYAAAAAAAAAAYRSSMFSAVGSSASGHYNHQAHTPSSQQDCNEIPKY